MKAIEFSRYGDLESLKTVEVEEPQVKDDQVMIKVMACALNRADMIMFSGKPYLTRLDGMALFTPKYPRLGSAVTGLVVSVGQAVTRFKSGDQVVGDLSNDGFGGLADYVVAPETHLALKPKSIPFEEAVASPMAAVVALQAVGKAGVKEGDKVLIHGASGGVGSYALQLAKIVGGHVTALCSTRHIDQARTLGADEVIDYTNFDTNTFLGRFDVILGINGYRSLKTYGSWLKDKGTYVMVGGEMKQILAAEIMGKAHSKGDKRLMSLGSASPNSEDIERIMAWLVEKKLTCPIEATYDFTEVTKAFSGLLKGHAKGKTVIVHHEHLKGGHHESNS